MPTPDDNPNTATATQRLQAALAERARGHDEVERRFWGAVGDEISADNIKQGDAADVLGLSRETVRKQLKRWVTQGAPQPEGP